MEEEADDLSMDILDKFVYEHSEVCLCLNHLEKFTRSRNVSRRRTPAKKGRYCVVLSIITCTAYVFRVLLEFLRKAPRHHLFERKYVAEYYLRNLGGIERYIWRDSDPDEER